MNVIILRITGMTCEHCANTVEKALSGVPGVVSATVSYHDKVAGVTVRSQISIDALVQYAVTERRCIQGGLTPAYSDHRGRMIRSGVTNGCAG